MLTVPGRRQLVGSKRASEEPDPGLSEVSTPCGAGEAAVLVLATQEFVANGGGRPSGRRRWSARRGGRAAVAVSVGRGW
jgi:hypothetical protein